MVVVLLAPFSLLLMAGPGFAIDDSYWLHDSATPGDWYEAANWTASIGVRPSPGFPPMVPLIPDIEITKLI